MDQNFPTIPPDRLAFLKTDVSKTLLMATSVLAVVYFIVLAFWFPRGNPVLFYILIAGEVFHMWMAFGYIHTVWDTSFQPKRKDGPLLPVDIFITVAGEPVEIVEATARAAKALDYPDFRVHLLNDGKVAKKDNWREIEALAKRLGVNCITRQVPGGAKGGNINHALTATSAPLVAIFDADQVPHPDFLQKTAGFFADPKMAFVQSPQYYKNYDNNQVTRGSWEQQELFFGAICKGKNRLNATFMCGTNMVIRRKALLAVGGMSETNIAEDFVTSLFMHKKGWKSLYVPEVLVEGLAPEDFLSYYNQQFRWARGSLEVIFKHNPLFAKGLTLGQRVQYLASASYYLSGFVVLANALLPLVYLYTGQVPLTISTMSLAAAFLPYIFLTVLVLKLSSNYTYTFRALSFSMSSFYIQIKAAFYAVLNKKSGFSVTSKQRLQGNFVHLSLPHIAYVLLAAIGLEVAIFREGLTAALFSNLAWVLFNIVAFTPFISASLPDTATAKVRNLLPRQQVAPPVAPKPGAPPVPSPNVQILQDSAEIRDIKTSSRN